MKSKMLWREASTPVENDDQATGDMEGYEVCSGEKPPSAAKAFMLGMRPSSMKRWASCGSMPSKPMMTRRLVSPLILPAPVSTRRIIFSG